MEEKRIDEVIKMIVKPVMSKDVHVATVPGSRGDLLELFKKHHVSGLPVIER